MAISFPTFEDQEILTAEKLNSFIQALEDKFNSGFGSADITWPLVAEDSLVMGTGASGYEIVGGTKILKLVNAAAYDTLAAAMTAAGTSGCVFIPPNTTILTDGVTLPSTGAVVGAGPSSIIKANAGASYVLNTSDGGSCLVANLTIDGNDGTATADGVRLVGQDQSIVSNVFFKNCNGPALSISTTCEQLNVVGCHFLNGSDNHIFADSIDGCAITGCTFENPAGAAIEMIASGVSALLRNVSIVGNNIQGCDQECINIIGSGGYSTSREGIVVTGNQIDHVGGGAFNSIVVGTVAGQMQNINVSGNQVHSAPQDAIYVYAQNGLVSGNNVVDAGQHGINCATSAYLTVSGNSAYSAANVGIRAVNGSTNLVIQGNNVLDCTTALQPAETSYHSNNVGAVGPGIGTVLYSTGANLTIPANTLKAGDVIEVWVHEDITAAGGSGRLHVTLDGQHIGSTESLTSTGNRQVHARVIITGPTAGLSQYTGITDDRGNTKIDRATVAGIDVTAVMTLTETHSNLTTTDGSIMTVTLYNGLDAS